MNSNIKRKHSKGSADWEVEIKKFGKISEVDKLFKKGETKPDGTKVSKDDGETIKVKVNDIEALLDEYKALVKVRDDKLNDLTEKRGYRGQAALIYKAYRHQQDRFNEWNNATNKPLYAGYYKDFLWDGTGTTNPYRTKGWMKLVDEYNKDTWLHNTTATDTNKYDGNIYDTNNNKWESISLTEQEAIKLLSQAVHFIGKIDKTKFNAKVDNPPSGVILTYTTNLVNKQAIKDAFSDIKDHADNLVEFKNGNHRTEYSFGSDYAKSDLSAMKDPVPFNKAEVEKVFKLLEFLYNNHSWVTHGDLADAFKDVPSEFDLVVRPALATPYKESELYGYEGYTADSFKNSSKATNFYKTDTNWDNAKTFKLKDGIMGWEKLVREFFDNHNSIDRKARVISSFDDTGTKPSPYQTFFDDIRGGYLVDSEFGKFTNSTHTYTLLPFPDYLDETETRLFELEADKDSIQTEIKDGRKDVLKAEKEIDKNKQEIKDKQTEIDNKIAEKLTELRKELKEKFKVDDATAPNFGSGTDATDANRLKEIQHASLQHLIKDIRYLVNFDEEKPTGKKNEDDAYQASKDIVDKVFKDFYQVSSGWNHITKDDDAVQTCRTDDERIEVIKKGKGIYQWQNLTYYHDKFVELEKIVKLEDYQVQAKNKLKEAIDKRTPQQIMEDWRNTLKTYEAGLEQALTDDKITKWKEKKEGQDAFNNVSSLETLIKKVSIMKKDADNKDVFDKVNDDFLSFVKGKDTKLITLTDLFKEKEPEDVILLVHQWEYNKEDDTKKAERHKKYAWSELGGKQEVDDYTLTDEDKKPGGNFEKFLYHCAVGKINYNSLEKPTQQQDDPNKKGDDSQMSWAKEWFGFGSVGKSLIAYVGIVLVIVGISATIWWDKIIRLWNGPKDESEKDISETDEEKEEGEE